jgi:hypothetical protein
MTNIKIFVSDDVLAGAYAATLVLFVLTLIYLLP